jgi:hypothetical protein
MTPRPQRMFCTFDPGSMALLKAVMEDLKTINDGRRRLTVIFFWPSGV